MAAPRHVAGRLALLALVALVRAAEERPADARAWTPAHVASWLSELGYAEHADAFAAREVGGARLAKLSDKAMLDELLVVGAEERSVLRAEIDALFDGTSRRAAPRRAAWAPDARLLRAAAAEVRAGAASGAERTTGIEPPRVGAERPVPEWSVADVETWLGAVGLPQYAQAFKSKRVDGRRLAQLDTAAALGRAVPPLGKPAAAGHRELLAQEVRELLACAVG